jgi:hypothetical protein
MSPIIRIIRRNENIMENGIIEDEIGEMEAGRIRVISISKIRKITARRKN